MAELTPFYYRHGDSFIHRVDTRCKMVLLMLISLSSLNASSWGLCWMTLFLALCAFWIQIPILAILQGLRYFFILLLLVFLARLFFSEGEALINWRFVTITQNGLIDGVLVCWRLLLIVLFGLIFISTTQMSKIKWSVGWLLSPLPFVPEKRIATMMGLIVRFIPIIFQKAHNISEIQKARCVEIRKNPFYRLKSFALPVMRGVIQDADKLSMAMTARCYNENLSIEHPVFQKTDWITLGMGILLSLLICMS
jgi:energy-coupling factor transporter transmembrane protein EcfT